MNIQRALLFDGAQGSWMVYADPVEVLSTTNPAQVLQVMAQVEQRVEAENLTAVGFVTYEAASGFDPALDTHPAAELPLVCFGLFHSGQAVAAPQVSATELGQLWRCTESAASYRQAIERIRELIAAGSVYQINHTTRLQGVVSDSDQLFAAVAKGAPHGAYLQGDSHTIVSASPECFFSLDGERIYSQPMKGTVAREGDREKDQAQADWLVNSAKNRAENLMITDMVRNDLGRIAQPGSVAVSQLFALEQYPTVWQLTSRIQAQTCASVSEIFQQLFPAASISGAPKRAAMAHIQQLENTPREIYTGAIGYIAPNRRAHFNIAIRTAWINNVTGVARYGAGGGVVWDSKPQEEHEELLSKTRILQQVVTAEDFELFETLAWNPRQGPKHLPQHLARMASSARQFGIPVGSDSTLMAKAQEAIQCAAAAPASAPDQRYRLRITMDVTGQCRAQLTPAPTASDAPQVVALAAQPVHAQNPTLKHKTNQRQVYLQARAQVQGDHGEQVEPVLMNQRNEVTETDIANLVYFLEGQQYTPPATSGLLPGILRQRLLDEGQIQERVLLTEELSEVDELYLINDLRGWRKAKLLR